jgi:hypothetical protein
MLLRLHAILSAVFVLILCSVTARAQAGGSTDGVYRIVSTSDTPMPGGVAVTSRPASSPPLWVRARRLRGARVVLYAIDNANAQYQLWVRSARRADCGRGLLRLGPHAIASNGWGSDDTSCSVSFVIDKRMADLAAACFSIPRQDRHVIGRDLRGAFAPARRVIRRGEDLEVVLSIHNPASAPAVMRFVGGRQRGPRNNRFSFTVERDGHPVTIIDAMDFGGLGGFQEAPPGSTGEVREHLSRWADISAPGHYVVQCRYETELAPGGIDTFDDAHRGKVWDRVFEGEIRFTVR